MNWRRGGALLAAAAVALGVGATAASAGNPVDITSCGDDPPRIEVDDILPGELHAVDVELCNEGSTTGVLSMRATGGGGVVADVVHVDLDGRWRGPVGSLPVTVDGAELAPGERETFTVGVLLDPSAGNAFASRRVRFHLHITLSGDETGRPDTVLGSSEALGVDVPVVAGVSLRQPLARTGADVAAAAALGGTLVAAGALGCVTAWRRRRP